MTEVELVLFAISLVMNATILIKLGSFDARLKQIEKQIDWHADFRSSPSH